MNKTTRLLILPIVLLVILVIVLIGVMYAVINHNFNLNFEIGKKLIYEYDYNEVEIDKISINSNKSDIRFEKSPNNKFGIKVYGNSNKNKEIKSYIKDTTLEIIFKDLQDNNFFLFGNYSNLIKVFVPENYEQKININCQHGDIDLSYVNNYETNLNIEHGDININNMKNVNIVSQHGDIKLGNIENSLKLSVQHGDLFANSITGSFSISQIHGDSKINRAYINKDSVITTEHGDISIDETSNICVISNTQHGDCNIRNNNKSSNIKLTAQTSFGDIRVNVNDKIPSENIINEIKDR